MAGLLLGTLDRSLQQRARANAAAAVRDDLRKAQQRREAAQALAAHPEVVPQALRPAR